MSAAPYTGENHPRSGRTSGPRPAARESAAFGFGQTDFEQGVVDEVESIG
jgi:hypothetical protein